MSSNNFKVKCIKVAENCDWITPGKVYNFKDGRTIWDDRDKSAYYNNVSDFLTIINDDCYEFIEYKENNKEKVGKDYCTIQDILLTDKFKDKQEFKMKLGDDESTYNVIYYKDILNHKYLKWKDKNEDLLLTDGYLTAKFYPVIPVKKSYIESIKALELIQQGKEVWCEYDSNLIKFNNPKTKKIQIDHVLNGQFYIMEEDK